MRDVLYISDLLDLFEVALANVDRRRGNVYNVGGGPDNTLSLLESLPLIEQVLGKQIEVKRGKMRPGDQYIYISDIGRTKTDFGWAPRIGVEKGIWEMSEWVLANMTQEK